MTTPIFLSDCTAKALKDVLDNRATATDGAGFGAGGGNQMYLVHCGDLATDNVYYGNVTLLQASALSFTDFTGDVFLWDANGGDLTPDNYYICMRHGQYTYDSDTYPLYTVSGGGNDTGDTINLVRPSTAMGGFDLGSDYGIYYWDGSIVRYGGAYLGEPVLGDYIWIVQRTKSTDETDELLTTGHIYMGDLQLDGEYYALNPDAPDDYRQVYFVVDGLADLGDLTCQTLVTSVSCVDGVIDTNTITVSIPSMWIYESSSACSDAIGDDEIPENKWISKEEHATGSPQ